MDIGREVKVITVEPMTVPVPQREERPARRTVPRKEPAPSKPVKVPEKVPAKP
jgi:hypothetical protein